MGKQSATTGIVFVVFVSGVKWRWKTSLGETLLKEQKLISSQFQRTAQRNDALDTHVVYIRLWWESLIEREEVLQFNRGFRTHRWLSALNSFQHFSKGYRHIVMHYSCRSRPLCGGWRRRKGWNKYKMYVFVAPTKRVATENVLLAAAVWCSHHANKH